jgi:hypothetical protein
LCIHACNKFKQFPSIGHCHQGFPIDSLDARSLLFRPMFKSSHDELLVLHGNESDYRGVSVPATTAVQCDARDYHGRYQHYGNSRRHDASVCDTPHARHEKVYNSGNPPNRVVRRTNFMDWAQLGQRGGVGAELLALSLLINENSVLELPPLCGAVSERPTARHSIALRRVGRINGADSLTAK